ncbi:DUF1700 domain-containing protein [Clostridium oceanicum]|uniref:DUF1700 domain-containing protein n=1 Tax=Clostridium oceanicum TaxID=1543 RepID=A0ABN1JE84_9CLOT
MNKKEFLNILYNNLKLNSEEKEEIMYDYKEHFDIGIKNGKNEKEIIKELGDPRKIAKQYSASEKLEKAKENPSVSNISSAIIAALGLGLFNLIFVLGFALAGVAILFSFIIISVVFIFSGGMFLISPILSYLPFVTGPNLPYIDVFLLSIIFISGGLLAFRGSVYLNKGFYHIMYSYMKKNIEIIKGRN